MTVEVAMMHFVGLTDLDDTSYTPIGLFTADPAAFRVREDLEFNTITDLSTPPRPRRAT